MTTQFIYGKWAVLESLRAGRRKHQKLLITESNNERSSLNEILELARAQNLEIHRVPRRVIDDLAKEANHQNVVLRTNDYPYVELESLLSAPQERGELPFFLALDLLKDPQNVGVLLRVADSVGVHGVILQTRRGVEITPAVVNASSGAVEHLAVAQVTNLVSALKKLKEQDIWIVGMEVGEGVQALDRVDLKRSLALVMGSEGEGMRRLVRDTCDLLVTLPMRGRVGSLNVATAGSIALYSAWQARGWEGWQYANRP